MTKKKIVKWEDLVDQEFVLMEESAPYSTQFEQVLAEHRISVQPFLKLQSTDMACKLVEKGKYLSILPLYSVKEAVCEEKIKVLKTPGSEQMQAVQIVLSGGKVIIPQIEGWMKELKSVLELSI